MEILYYKEILMKLYHGSENIIEKPELLGGKKHNDYGRGFYTTRSIELAKEWACKKGKNGFVSCYELDVDKLSVLNLNSHEYSVMNWLAILTRNRSYWQKNSIAEEAKNYLQEFFYIEIDNYDVIKGYRADDSYFSFAQDFIMGSISYEKLCHAMYLGELGEQYALKSKKSFDIIKYVDFDVALADEYYVKKVQRDKEARRRYREYKGMLPTSEELYIVDVLRKGFRHDDFIK